MTKEHAVNLLRSLHSPFYMIRTHQSRSGATRHYRIIAVINSCEIEDITALVARACGSGWDEVRGTYNATKGTMLSQDRPSIESYLRQVLNRPKVCVFML